MVYYILYRRPTVHFILPYFYQSSFLAATIVINAYLTKGIQAVYVVVFDFDAASKYYETDAVSYLLLPS